MRCRLPLTGLICALSFVIVSACPVKISDNLGLSEGGHVCSDSMWAAKGVDGRREVSAGGRRAVLPVEVHASFARAIERADLAAGQGDAMQALALVHGVLYPEGVSVRLDRSSLGSVGETGARAFQRGVWAWEQALGQDNPIRVVAGGESEVVVRFVDRLPEGGSDTLGLIELRKEYRWNRARYETVVSGVISLLRSYEGQALGEEELTEVVAHELGHLLGLADVEFTGHLMGPAVLGLAVTGPLPHEIRAVQVLRQAARLRYAELRQGLAAELVGVRGVGLLVLGSNGGLSGAKL